MKPVIRKLLYLVLIITLVLIILAIIMPSYHHRLPPETMPSDPEAPYERPGTIEHEPSSDHQR